VRRIDEEGTEAAAVTSVDWEYGGPTTMRINRPFFFVIRDNHSQILHFVGKIVEPILE
jgi:serine protease inhibitor